MKLHLYMNRTSNTPSSLTSIPIYNVNETLPMSCRLPPSEKSFVQLFSITSHSTYQFCFFSFRSFSKSSIFYVGFNDRQYVNFTIRIHLDKVMSAAEKAFPKSQIYFAALNNFNVSSLQQANLGFLVYLRTYSINQNEISVLDKGLKFVLTSLQIFHF